MLDEGSWQEILVMKEKVEKRLQKEREHHAVLLESYPTEILKEIENTHYQVVK